MDANFTLDSLSPMVSYNQPGSWNWNITSQYPNDTQTSTKVGGSSVAFSFSGSNLWIYGAPEGNTRNYAVSVDSVDQKLDENYETDVIYNQESVEGLYDIVLNSTNDSDLVFDSVMWQLPSGCDERESFDSSDDSFVYEGGWDLRSSRGSGFDGHTTITTSASAKFSFNVRTMAVIYGLVCSDCGQYSVTIDGNSKSTTLHNASRPISTAHETALYYTTFKNPGKHSLVISHVDGSGLSVSRADVMHEFTGIQLRTSNKVASRTLNVEDTIAIVVSAVVFTLILLGLYIYNWRRDRKKQEDEPTTRSNPFADQATLAHTADNHEAV